MTNYCLLLTLFFVTHDSGTSTKDVPSDELILITVATEKTDGFNRFIRSAEKYHHTVKVLGLDKKWKGGDVKRFPGGGQKVNLLRAALKDIVSTSPKSVVLFTDSYDVIINGPADKILDRFRKSGSKILFSAEKFCWPDASLAVSYPVVKSGKRYLNSGMFIGYVKDLYEMVSLGGKIGDADDDQLYYTKIYLDKNEKLNIKLDHLSSLFQNLNGVGDEVDIFMKDPENGNLPSLRNLAYSTTPLVVHGNGDSKIMLNNLGRYLGKSWTVDVGCVDCQELGQTYTDSKPENLPMLTLALFVERPTPFLARFFDQISVLQYPKSKIHLFLHNNESYHSEVVDHFVDKYGKNYAALHYVKPADLTSERDARNGAINFARKTDSKFMFVVDADVRLTSESVILKMMDRNKPIIAPMINKPNKLFSNFWGDINADGFYTRSDDYVDIVENARRGIWNVPHVSGAYLIQRERLNALKDPYSFDGQFDPDMSFTRYILDQGFFMYVDNLEAYGYLVTYDEYDIKLKHPDFYQMFDNSHDWESEYLHPDYRRNLDPASVLQQPCPDVYWFPVFADKFCHQLIDIMEHFGKWSTGTNQDERLTGGYENVPTRDIHTNQVGLERHWLHMLDKYFRPVQEKVYIGYFHVPPHAVMNFVVRYKPDEQPSLRPHHDASTYTVNLALNQHGVDYEGGGSHFIRYNCSLVKGKTGWALIHPGRLTHYHEGLPTTSGTRYIMVSFVDP